MTIAADGTLTTNAAAQPCTDGLSVRGAAPFVGGYVLRIQSAGDLIDEIRPGESRGRKRHRHHRDRDRDRDD